jgi:hypothetical protein
MVVALDDLDYEVGDVMLSNWDSIMKLKKMNSKTFVNLKKHFQFHYGKL